MYFQKVACCNARMLMEEEYVELPMDIDAFAYLADDNTSGVVPWQTEPRLFVASMKDAPT